jgi:hypothetical protein
VTAIMAIDPGPEKSAYCVFEPGHIDAAIVPNAVMKEMLKRYKYERVAIEFMQSFGMPVGKETFETCVWIGRFIEASGVEPIRVYRKEVCVHLCGSARAKDPNVRRALIDRFGEPGTKKAPGLLYGVSKDMWSALGIAVTAYDRLGGGK